MLYSPVGRRSKLLRSSTHLTHGPFREPGGVTGRRICRGFSLCFQPRVFWQDAEIEVLPQSDQELAGQRDDPDFCVRGDSPRQTGVGPATERAAGLVAE